MAITVVWTDNSQSPAVPITLQINDTAIASMENYRQTLTQQVPNPEIVNAGPRANTAGKLLVVSRPIYPDVLSMVVGELTKALLVPAFAAFPPSEVQTAAQTALAAAEALAEAQETFILSAIAQQ